MWFPLVISSWITISTIVSTLRAGSRVWYLLGHQGRIGKMEGPLITSSSNNTHIYESTLGFRHAVSLAFQQSPPPPTTVWSSNTTITSEKNKRTNHNFMKKSIKFPSILQHTKHGIQWWFHELQKITPTLSRRSKKKYNTKKRNKGEEEEDDLDFQHSISSILDIPSNHTKNTNSSYKITCYAPKVFDKLRQQFGISQKQFIQSILLSGPYISFQSNSKGAARSGGFFFFTSDGTYMIKTIKKAEVATFFEMLPKYYTYMKRNARRSLLTRFFGIYSIGPSVTDKQYHLGVTATEEEKEEQYFIIMNAVFPAEGSKFISTRFDLKGSTVGRKCSEEEQRMKKSEAVLKDLDLNSHDITIGPSRKSNMLLQLRNDVSLLQQCGVMDYSLLVGIVNLDLRMDIQQQKQQQHQNHQQSAMVTIPPKQKRRLEQLLPFLSTIRTQQQQQQYNSNTNQWMIRRCLSLCRIIISLPYYVYSRTIYGTMDRLISSVITLPLPYYGAGRCGIDTGPFSIQHGTTTKSEDRAIFYLGIIDFLQPWTKQKVVENRLKGWIGYDTSAISCVHPDMYAQRFLQFLSTNIQ